MRAQDSPSTVEQAGQSQAADESQRAETQRIAELISQLGSSRFEEREAASAELLAGGEAALSGLRSIGSTATYEVRHRGNLIQRRIEDDKFTALSRSFLLDLDADNSYGLPAWRHYRQLVGGSRTSKLLFLDMVRRQPELAQLIEEASSPNPPRAVFTALDSLASIEAVLLREEIFSLRDTHVGDAVAMLLVAATLPGQTPIEISEIIVTSERRSFGGHLTQQGYGDCLRKLLAAWLPKTHPSMAPTAMDCALRHRLSEGLDIARRHLSKNFDSDTRKLAFYFLARFGNETDIALLMPLLSEKTVVDEFSPSAIASEIHISNAAPPGATRDPTLTKNLVVRINDLALTTAMLLSSEDPTEFYPRFETHVSLGFFIHSLAAPVELVEQQQQRIDQWKQKHLPPQAGS